MRVCGDYKSTLNPNLEAKEYPLPTTEECFQPLAGGQKFTRLDIRQAYNNLILPERDRLLTTINTHLGLFAWNKLPYGVKVGTAIFQERIDEDLWGIPLAAWRVDDIICTGRNDEEHLNVLTQIVERLEKSGFRCNLKKTSFLQPEVVFLGYVINSHGIRPLESKVETLKQAKYPENLTELVSFLSAVQYYGRFIRNLSTIVEPLNVLRRGVPWNFGVKEKNAFDRLREALASTDVLVPYHTDLLISIETDASATGLGAVISHIMPDGRDRPIEYASRTLSVAERKYSQIEKEALGIIWG